jgi:hypothetical protein
MLTHLKLENFKIWRSTGPIRLAPITLLLGTNSSGKSSLIQSLLLIRQTVKETTPIWTSIWAIPMPMIPSRWASSRICSATMAPPVKAPQQLKWALSFAGVSDGQTESSTLFSARYNKGQPVAPNWRFCGWGKTGKALACSVANPGFTADLGRAKEVIRPKRRFSPGAFICLFSGITLNKLGTQAELIKPIGPALLDELARIIYLGPVRRLAQRDYVWAGRMPAHIGDDGAKAVDALIASGVARQSALKRKQALPAEAHFSSKRFIG